MRSNYKKLGGFIRQVDERNKNLRVKRLLGVSISKVFIESIANLNGTEMNYYKIVKRNQFAYGPVTSRNGEKVSIACLNNEDECIISSSYAVFEIIDTTKLLPKYLMLWFKRPEFDRYARYHSHGSVREIFGWDELCNVELPIPTIQKQKEIVDAYEAIELRIKLKRQINDNLEAQAIELFNTLFMRDIEQSTITFGRYVSFLQGTQVPVENQFPEQNCNMARFVRIIDYTTDGYEPPRFIVPPSNATYIDLCEVSIVRYGNIGLIGRHISGIIANNLFKVVSNGLLTNSFIYYYLNQNLIQQKIKNSEESSAMPAIRHSTIGSLPINEVNGDTLQLFDKFCNSTESMIIANKQEIRRLISIQKSIMCSLSN